MIRIGDFSKLSHVSIKTLRYYDEMGLLKSVEVYEHSISADGRQLAALRLREAKKFLIVYDLQAMKLICEAPVSGREEVSPALA